LKDLKTTRIASLIRLFLIIFLFLVRVFLLLSFLLLFVLELLLAHDFSVAADKGTFTFICS
jgi:hypothetical protein